MLLAHFNVGHVLEVVGDAARGREISQIVGEFLGVHMVGVSQRGAHIPAPKHLRGARHVTDDRLGRNRLHEGNRTVGIQPGPSGPVDWLNPVAAEGVMVEALVIVEPVLIADRLLEGRIRRLHELRLIEAGDGQDMLDRGDGCLADRNARDVWGFDQADFHGGRIAAIVKGAIEVGCCHPAGRPSAYNQHTSHSAVTCL